MASRYLATVRRAMSTPASLSISTMRSSDRTRLGVALGLDHLADLVAHALGRMGRAAVRRGDGGGEEEFHLEHAARRGHVFVGGDPADGGFVHADGLGDGLQVQRPQVLDADRPESRPAGGRSRWPPSGWSWPAGPGSHQPVGRGQAVGDEGLVGVAARAAGDPGVIALVDQQPGQGVAVQLHVPQPARALAHDHVGRHRRDRLAAESRAGPGRQGAQFGRASRFRSSSSTPQTRRRPAMSRRATSSRLSSSAAMAGSKPVALLQLQRQAFGDARARTRRSARSPAAAASTASTRASAQPSRSATSPSRRADSRLRRRASISTAAIAALGGGQASHRQLVVQVFGQRLGPLQRAVQALAVGVERAAAPGLGPVDRAAGLIAARRSGRRRRRRGRPRRRGPRAPASRSAVAAVSLTSVGARSRCSQPRARLRTRPPLRRPGPSRCSRGLRSSSASTVGVELDARQLQQLDRLLQLRRDDQALALPQF